MTLLAPAPAQTIIFAWKYYTVEPKPNMYARRLYRFLLDKGSIQPSSKAWKSGLSRVGGRDTGCSPLALAGRATFQHDL
jgi:hypothetical protein